MRINRESKYKIIYADPPWAYGGWGKCKNVRNAAHHYKLMTTEEICKLNVDEISDKDSMLFMWATYPLLPEALQVMNTWGFKYVTVGFTWVKLNKDGSPFIGLGAWTRANAEIVLIGRKGKGLKRIRKDVKQIILEQRREHSRKPDCVRERIVDLVGDLPRIELFARSTAFGWDSWGNETTKFD